MRHKLLAGIIPFCSGKRKPSTFTSSSLTDCNRIATNNNMLHSKSTYFYRWSSRYISIAPIACALTLLVGIGLFLNPAAKAQEVYAAGESGPATTGSSISFNFNDNTQPNTTTTVDSGYASYITNTFAVHTTNVYKYDMYITAAEGYTEKLVGSTYRGVINGVGSNVATDAFGENTWGYALTKNTSQEDSALLYSTIPAYGAAINPQYSSPYDLNDDNTDTFKLTFAARIMGDTRPSDHYYSQTLISVAATAKEVVEGFGGVKTMQEFTADICKNRVSAGTTGRLEDIRKNADGSTRVYWVAKLADGNCWMTQNLDLDLYGLTLTPDDSDVQSAWDAAKEVQSAVWNSNTVAWYDPGKYVYINRGFGTGWCDGSKPGLTGCSSGNFTDITNWTASTQVNFSPIADTATKVYNAHYSVGNYYSWLAAVAGNRMKATTDKTPPESICPKNWKLEDRSLENLLSKYGLTKGVSGTIDGKTYSIFDDPLYFTPVGRVLGGISGMPTTGFYLLSTVQSGTESSTSYAYTLNFSSNSFTFTNSGNNPISQGTPVRCFVPSE